MALVDKLTETLHLGEVAQQIQEATGLPVTPQQVLVGAAAVLGGGCKSRLVQPSAYMMTMMMVGKLASLLHLHRF